VAEVTGVWLLARAPPYRLKGGSPTHWAMGFLAGGPFLAGLF